jgi:hypothetical protein
MLLNLALGIVLMIGTVLIHSGAMILILKRGRDQEPSELPTTTWYKTGRISVAVLIVFFATLIEATLWAVTYVALRAIDTFEAALYFSMVTFTTLGYGDVTLDDNWRLLSSIQAANGVIMFGWTTALVVAVLQRLYKRDNPK